MIQQTPVPPDIAYTLDTMLEHTEIDAGTYVAIKLYAPRVDLMTIIDGDDPFNGTRDRMGYRSHLAAKLDHMADDILRGLPVQDRGAIAHAGIQHMRGEVLRLAWCCAVWAIEDEIKGGCLEPFKRRMSALERRYELSPKQRRQLNAPSWIRRYVKLNRDAQRLRGMGFMVTRRAAGIPREIVADAADLLAAQLTAQHEGYRRTNQRALSNFADSLRSVGPSKRSTRKRRSVIKKAASTASALIGDRAVSDFAAGRNVILHGTTLDLDVLRLGSSSSLGHGGLAISAVEPKTGRRLADLCVYHEQTPALDQLTALHLAMSAGEEAEIITTANLSRVTDLGMEHPLIAERGKSNREQPWRPRDEVAEKNEAYWLSTKPLWVNSLGVFVLGRMWDDA